MRAIDTIIVQLEKNRKTIQLILGVLVTLIILATEADAQSTEGFIYGKVKTSENTYIGLIRWGKEEVYWNDHYNATKLSDRHQGHQYRERDRENSWSNFDWSLSSIWDNRGGNSHQFVVQFGDIAEIDNYNRERPVVILKNDMEVKTTGGGSNDMKPTLKILDSDLGEISIRWSRVERVQFLPTPRNLKETFGPPLYGTVNTFRKGDIKGYIQWDHDERLGSDKLDGRTRDGELSIPFKKIKSIESGRSGSTVELWDGRNFYVTGSNDVNAENRGIIVSVENVGKVDIPWKVFNKVNFERYINSSGKPYSSYSTPKGLQGKVITYEEDVYSGRIVYDLDEAMEVEFLEGKDEGMEYKIPFRNIKKIKPKNYTYSQIELRNGDVLILGEGRDVSDDNGGLLIFQNGKKEPEYVPWKKVSEIIFE
ncbi:hypothetical protein FNH22_17560 [Fulvivirga sp. M361]|uniref:hypothetical protein n=1 Tax=Fulvivirga sp. M361 TaxID=2594266 RepID=UPI00117B0D14|nr:hypothetical protein [Fulvivirga sp. M361]TRX55970.1 hypothetical protein FNH22_17560 [Fulvivirga sp. M361]